MTPLREWLRPPRSLLVLLFLLALVSVSVLGWFGWKLLDQERIIDAQRSQERLEQAADRIAATLRGALAESGERIGSWEAIRPSEPGLLIYLTENTVAPSPGGVLLYDPLPTALPEAVPETFAEAEVLEFQRNRPAEALAKYEALAQSPNASSVRVRCCGRPASYATWPGRTTA